MFETPVSHLMNPVHHQVLHREFEGVSRKAFAIEHDGRVIWGVTAGIVRGVYERVFARCGALSLNSG